jgi:hypothetical protein
MSEVADFRRGGEAPHIEPSAEGNILLRAASRQVPDSVSLFRTHYKVVKPPAYYAGGP